MTVYILVGEYDCQGSSATSIIAVKKTEEEVESIARHIDKIRDGWDSLIIQEWTEFGLRDEREV